jgi:signal transduction histidine kinase
MATEEVRRLVEDLRPPMLDEFGLIEALRNLRFVPPDLVVDVVAPGAVILPAAAEVALYRIGAEALHNVVRHSRATRCELRLDVSGERVTLTVDDDGRGLPAWTAPRDTASRGRRHTGVGILAMHERAEELGGTVAVGPSGCGGTIVVASIPLDRSRAAAP